MSEIDAPTTPVEATQDQAANENPVEQTGADQAQPVEEKPTEEKPTEEKLTEEKPAEEKSAEKNDAQDTTMLKTTAKVDYENRQNNRKFDPSTREVTDDPDLIRKQVEFYFGDWNFPQDKFMWESCEGAENKPMPIKTIHTFKRMRIFQPYSAVVAALRESSFLEISGEEGEEVVKRKVPYKPMPASKAKTEACTVYVKGFGDETPNTQFELEEFFGAHGDVKGIKLRRTNENLFKGSVFVTFVDEGVAKKFIETDPTPKWKGHDLKVMSKHDYCEEKNELIRQGKLEPNGTAPKKFFEGRDPSNKGARGRGRGGYQGSRDPDDWKKRRDHDQKRGFQDRRGGRGRGRGRGGRDFRNGRDDRRNRDEKPRSTNNANPPTIQSTSDNTPTDAAASNGKRARDEDSAQDAPAAKKVDTKQESGVEANT